MAIVLTSGRPILFEQSDGALPAATAPWEGLDQGPARVNLEAAAKAVGYLVAPSMAAKHPMLANVVAIGPRLVMTARHAAEMFSTGAGESAQLKADDVSVTFGSQVGGPGTRRSVRAIRFLHPWWDVALLELDETVPIWLRLSSRPPAGDATIVSVGYPHRDFRNDPIVVESVLGGTEGRRSWAPGLYRGQAGVPSPSREVLAACHDASALTSSGAPLVDPVSGNVVAIGFAGRFLVSNYATPAWELARDPVVRRHGVRFDDDPVWLDVWDTVPETESDEGDDIASRRSERVTRRNEGPTEVLTTPLLAPDRLSALADTMYRGGIDSRERLDIVLGWLDRDLAGSLRQQSPAVRDLLLELLQQLNWTGEVKGTVPLVLFVDGARDRIHPRPEAARVVELIRPVVRSLPDRLQSTVPPSFHEQ